jgi:hypothetical protein
MIQSIALLLLIATISVFISNQVKADVYIQPIIGLMFGALYSKDRFEEESLVQHTLQCCIGFISLTIIWIEKEK